MKKIFVILLLIFSMTGFVVIQAETDTSVHLVFNKESFKQGEIIQIDFLVGDANDFLGLQIDFKENEFFEFYDGVVPYRTNELLELQSMTEIFNDFDSNNQDIATLILIGEEGETLNGSRPYASLFLIAKQDMDSIFDYISITNVLEDVSFGLYTMSIKLSDSSANPIDYQVQYLVKHQAKLNPGIDTVYLGEDHNDAGIELINVASENAQVTIQSDVDTSVAGEYLIRYHITNLTTGIVIEIDRYVYVLSIDGVDLKLNPTIDTYELGDAYMEAGAVAKIGASIFDCDVLYTDIDMDQEGTYKVIYGYEHQGVMYRITRIITVINFMYSVEEN